MSRVAQATKPRSREAWAPYYERARDERNFAPCPACRGRDQQCEQCSGLGSICTRAPDGWTRINADGRLERTIDDGATWHEVPRCRRDLRPRVFVCAVEKRSRQHPDGVPHEVQLDELARWVRVQLGIEHARSVADVLAIRDTRQAARSATRERLRIAAKALHATLDRTTRARDRERLVRAFARKHAGTFEELLAVEPLLPRGPSLVQEGRPRELEGELFAAAAGALGVKLPVIVRAVYAHLDPCPELDVFVDGEYHRIRAQTKRRSSARD